MRYIALLVGLLVGICTAILTYFSYRTNRLPANRPTRFVRQAGKPVVVCVGASTVQGTFSYDFVTELERRIGDAFQFVNAGVNGELTYNVLQRMDEVIACWPDFVVVFIGGNDINASLYMKYLVRAKKVPHEPSPEWYRTELREIVNTLQQQTTARIALLSQSVKGELLNSPANRLAAEYTAVAHEVANETGVAYLPLYERLVAYLREHQRSPGHDLPTSPWLMLATMARRFLLGQSWDDISASHGFLLVTEGAHLNSRSGMMIADLIENFLHSASPPIAR